jgi:PhzF family phenazine biosynthesis protein
MRLPLYQVDAFSATPLNGNPAAVVPLESWLPDTMLKAIAAENNLAETAYVVRRAEGTYELRWFTPQVEVDLCGHATLATSWVLFEELGVRVPTITFHTRGGELRVSRDGDVLAMDFPVTIPESCEPPPQLLQALGIQSVRAVLQARDYIVVVDNEEEIAKLAPDFRALKECTTFGVAVTAPGKSVDFVSRWFGPKIGVDEDITTGVAHTFLAMYWSKRLGKDSLTAVQGSERKGHVGCKVAGDRVILSGRAATYMVGFINV